MAFGVGQGTIGRGIIPVQRPPPPPVIPPPPTSPAPPIQVVAGLDPNELAQATYGQKIPVIVIGKARLGARIVFGPYIDSGRATFGVSFGHMANVTGTRGLKEIALDSKLVWQASSYVTSAASGTFLAEPFTVRWTQGTMTQAVDALETARFGNEAIAYRPHLMMFFENLPLAPFNNKVPWVAGLWGDTTDGADPEDGITLGTAFDRLAKSPWVGHTSDTFATTGVNDVIGGMLIADDRDFLSHVKAINRFYRNFSIIQSDKLYIRDRGSQVAPDIVLTRDNILQGPVLYTLEAPTSIPRELELITINPDADYSRLPYKAQFPRHPVPVSASVGRESVELPLILSASDSIAIATYAKYQEETARLKVSLNAMVRGANIEPGDYVGLQSLGNGFDTEIIKVLESTLNGDWSNSIVGELIMRCDQVLPPDPDFAKVVLLLGGEGANGSTSFVDESPAAHGAAAVNATAAVTTLNPLIGDGSILLNGGLDGIFFGGSLDWGCTDTQPYTVEAFVQTDSATFGDDRVIMAQWSGLGGEGFLLQVDGSTNQLRMFTSADGSDISAGLVSSGLTWSTGTRYHVAWDKDATRKMRLYRDGVMVASGTPANGAIFNNGSNPLTIGYRQTVIKAWFGRVDEARITKGLARYASDGGFTPPTTAFPRS